VKREQLPDNNLTFCKLALMRDSLQMFCLAANRNKLGVVWQIAA
jgi:hypothetical protein